MPFFPYIAFILYVAIGQVGMAEIIALIIGYFSPEIFPSLVQRAPNDSQNMKYNNAGYWSKSPTVKSKDTTKYHFTGKARTLQD